MLNKEKNKPHINKQVIGEHKQTKINIKKKTITKYLQKSSTKFDKVDKTLKNKQVERTKSQKV